MEFSSALEIGFRAKSAAEFDQRLAIVVAMTVKSAVDPALNPAFEGVEDGSCTEDSNNQSPFAHLAHGFRQAPMYKFGDQRDDAEVAAEDEGGGQRVGYTALEDQVSVHQAVADDGPTESKRQKDKRETRKIREKLRRVEMQKIGDRVKEREG